MPENYPSTAPITDTPHWMRRKHVALRPDDSPTLADMVWNPEWHGIGGAHVPVRHWLWDEQN